MRRIHTISVATLLIAIATSGCSVLKASPAKEIRFLPNGALLAEQPKRAPFNGYWVKEPGAFFRLKQERSKLYIAPVRTEIVEAELTKKTKDPRTLRRLIEETHEVARYFRERIRLSIENLESRIVSPIETPTPDALTLELALVEVMPTNPGINIIGTAAGFLIPGGGLIKSAGSGSVAFEGLVKDGDTVIEQFRDREGDKSAPATIKDYQRFGHIREAMDDWASQLAELENTPPEHQVAESLPFTLNPF